jgi:hypothetical protein
MAKYNFVLPAVIFPVLSTSITAKRIKKIVGTAAVNNHQLNNNEATHKNVMCPTF